MNEQITGAQPAVQTNKKPVWVTVIAIVSLLYWLSTAYLSIGLGALGSFNSILTTNIYPLSYKLLTLLGYILPLILLVSIIGLFKMKKWALYGYCAVLIYTVITSLGMSISTLYKSRSELKFSDIFSEPTFLFATGLTLIIVIIYALIVTYLWKIRKQFN